MEDGISVRASGMGPSLITNSSQQSFISTRPLPTHLSSLPSELISQSLFLSYDEKIIAKNLTLRFHYLFCTIPLYEFSIDYGFTKNHPQTPQLNRFRLESEKLQEFIGNQILMFDDLMVRAEVVIQIIRVAEILARQRSHHTLMMLVFALQSHSIHRLKTTWAVVHARIPGRWDILQDLIGFGGQKLTTYFCSRQSVEGVSEDLREHLKLTIPSHLQLSDSLTRFLDSNEIKTLRVTNLPEGKSLSFGVLASKEAYPTKGGLPNSTTENSFLLSRATIATTANRSCSYVDLHKSSQHESSSHCLSSLQDKDGKRGSKASSNLAEESPLVKRQFLSPKVFKLKPKFVLKRRFSFPLSRKDISRIKHAIDYHEILTFPARTVGAPAIEVEEAECTIDTHPRSSSTNTFNLSHVFGTTERPQRLRTQSDIIDEEDDDENEDEDVQAPKPAMTEIKGKVDGKIEDQPVLQYRDYLVEKLFVENRPVYGTVKSDGLGESGGTPKASGKPCLPYVNGILGRIIRLKEIPSFIKTEIHNPTTRQPVGCYYCAQSPGLIIFPICFLTLSHRELSLGSFYAFNQFWKITRNIQSLNLASLQSNDTL